MASYEEYLKTLLDAAQEVLREHDPLAEQWEVTLGYGEERLDLDAVRAGMEEDGALVEGVRLSMLDAMELLEQHRLLPPEQRLVVVAHMLLGEEKAQLFTKSVSGATSTEAGIELLGLAVHAEVVRGLATLQLRPPELSDVTHRALECWPAEAEGNWKELYLSQQHTLNVGWGWQVEEEEELSILQGMLKTLRDMRDGLITLHMLTG